jgi:two-component system, cell cycle response regulator
LIAVLVPPEMSSYTQAHSSVAMGRAARGDFVKILIADDDPLSVLYVRDMLLEWGHEVVQAADSSAALARLRDPDGPTLAILDSLLAGEEGTALCRAIRESVTERYVYIIMLAARDQSGAAEAATAAGADDCIGKPFSPEQLRVRVRAGIRIAELEERLHFRESRDALTGIYNRATILELLQKELARQARTHHAVSVIFCDLDYFKSINDTLGHQAGDEVLREVTRRMMASLRPYDSFGRYGGEELLGVLPNCALPGALEVAERMRAAVADVPVTTSAGEVLVTISIGVGSVGVDQPANLGELLQGADDALHRAKQNGRNCITIAGEYNPL